MLTIGDFARLGELSVRMLRHYDALGLLTPVRVDEYSGYRYYDVAQLGRLNRLLALKDLGLSLEQVRTILDHEVDADELRGMLRLRQAELAERLKADTLRLADVERRLRIIEKEGVMSDLEFVSKSMPSLLTAQLATTVTAMTEIPAFLSSAFPRLVEASGRPDGWSVPSIATYSGDDTSMRVTANFPVTAEGQFDGLEGVEIVELPAFATALTVVHHGDMASIGASWQALVQRVTELGHELTGPCREVYLHTSMRADQSDWVTELQQPYRG